MAETKEYYVQKLENGSIQISDEVIASIAAGAVLEVEGVCGLSSSISTDIAEMLGRKTLAKGVRLSTDEANQLTVICDVVMKYGSNVFDCAKEIQGNVKSSIESVSGLTVSQVHVNICGISVAKENKK